MNPWSDIVGVVREEFERHGLMEVVTVACRDVCAAGFGLEGVADAGMLLIVVGGADWAVVGVSNCCMFSLII